MIFILEDDDAIRELVCYSLDKSGMNSAGFSTPAEFWSAVGRDVPELVILDIMLPGEDGLSVLKKLRAETATKKVPVMMLTARDSEFDKVSALDGGADDYITKPFGVMELLSRVRAVLRRYTPESEETEKKYTAGELEVSVTRHTVSVGGEPVTLTLKEFELLTFLFSRNGAAVTRDVILEQVWGQTFVGETRTVDVHIRTLRQKLGKCGDIIETVRGVGYRIGG